MNEEKLALLAQYVEHLKEKIKWAIKVTRNWKTEDERRTEAREKERQRRQRNRGMEERKLIDAVDALDDVRPVISDQFNEDGFPKPPEIRNKLLRLHDKAHKIINGEFNYDTDRGMFDLAWELEEELFDAIENLEKIKKVIDDLTNLTPSEEDEDDLE